MFVNEIWGLFNEALEGERVKPYDMWLFHEPWFVGGTEEEVIRRADRLGAPVGSERTVIGTFKEYATKVVVRKGQTKVTWEK